MESGETNSLFAADTVPTQFTSDQIRAPYITDVAVVESINDEGLLMMPVTHGPARIIRVHSPCGHKLQRFSLERVGEEPSDLATEEDTDEQCLARSVRQQWHPGLMADGVTRLYHSAGQYVYLLPRSNSDKPKPPEGGRSAQ